MAVDCGGHSIEVKADRLWGGQVASYDSEEVAKKRAIGDTVIDFVVTENGQKVVYEVQTSVEFRKGPSIREVRRNGEPVYELWRDRLECLEHSD